MSGSLSGTATRVMSEPVWIREAHRHTRCPPRVAPSCRAGSTLDGVEPTYGGRSGKVVSLATYLLVIGERSALAWILKSARMAFPHYREREVKELPPGDELLLYVTRGGVRGKAG
jgi:hypothetical protein